MTIKKIIPIIFISIIILLIGAGYFLVWPKFQDFRAKRKEIEVKKEEITLKEEYLLNLSNVSEELLMYKDEISKIDSVLPVDPSVAALFSYFQKTSSENGLIFKEIDVSQLFGSQQTKSTEGKIRKMPFSIMLTGSYASVKNLILAVYLNARLIEIKSMDFSLFSEEEVKNLFDFSLKVETQSYNPSYTQESNLTK